MYCGKLLRTAGSFPSQQLGALDQLSPATPVIWLLQSAPLLGFFRAIHHKNTAIYLVKYGCATLLHARSFGRVRPRRKNRWNSRVGIECSVILRTLTYLRVTQKHSNPAVTNP